MFSENMLTKMPGLGHSEKKKCYLIIEKPALSLRMNENKTFLKNVVQYFSVLI